MTGLSYLIHAHLTAYFIPISENICCLLCKIFNFTFIKIVLIYMYREKIINILTPPPPPLTLYSIILAFIFFSV